MAELRKVVQLSAERHQVDRTDIVRPKDVVHLVVSLRVHRKAMTVVGEVVRVLVVARTRLVGQVGGNGLNLTHELITDEGVVSVQIWEIGKSGKIGHVTHVEENIVIAALHLLCQTTKRATVDVTKVSVDDELRTPRLTAGQRLEVVQRTPAVSGTAVVGVPTGGRQIGQVHSVNEHESASGGRRR
ncbi:hypothetical protein TYRP_007355 [Tyrophagus putrescentiae]|nr:hypothetical protein TYRP_007355 [Tyrophagus putrescentiae]